MAIMCSAKTVISSSEQPTMFFCSTSECEHPIWLHRSYLNDKRVRLFLFADMDAVYAWMPKYKWDRLKVKFTEV